jgi:ketosteroid isomerase-like protein
MKWIYTALFVALQLTVFAGGKDEKAIRGVLSAQAEAWNRGSIDEYMKGYWNNDSLLFIGKNGPTYGYTNTLERYKKSYADTVQMGKLRFDILQVKKLSGKHYFVCGKWHLQRKVGDIGGSFTLVFKKIKGQWLIISDHSS